jgi:hypothetical protein
MDFLGGINPNPRLVTPNFEHRNDNTLANVDAFLRSSA